MADPTTTVMELRLAVEAFVAERNWQRYHNAKDLAISIAIEAGELLEEFQWQDAAEVAAASADPEARARIRFELADVLIYCLSLGNALELDLSEAVLEKLALSQQKYPAAQYRGQYRRPGRRGDFTAE